MRIKKPLLIVSKLLILAFLVTADVSCQTWRRLVLESPNIGGTFVRWRDLCGEQWGQKKCPAESDVTLRFPSEGTLPDGDYDFTADPIVIKSLSHLGKFYSPRSPNTPRECKGFEIKQDLVVISQPYTIGFEADNTTEVIASARAELREAISQYNQKIISTISSAKENKVPQLQARLLTESEQSDLEIALDASLHSTITTKTIGQGQFFVVSLSSKTRSDLLDGKKWVECSNRILTEPVDSKDDLFISSVAISVSSGNASRLTNTDISTAIRAGLKNKKAGEELTQLLLQGNVDFKIVSKRYSTKSQIYQDKTRIHSIGFLYDKSIEKRFKKWYAKCERCEFNVKF